ncbi:hypothetical protein [Daejeonella sp.]|uniref:hypothetical protein n=1 Tax=Daejeonella sp. TaxID=2805397 RepID=UPI0039839D8C
MNNLNPTIFIIPVIALTLLGIFYVFFLKKTTNKSSYKYLIFILFILAFFLNLVWELLQGPLYFGYNYDAQHITFCALASVADANMVVLLYFALTLIYKNVFWIRELTVKRILLIMVIGGIGAIIFELRHIMAGSWVYSDSMPIIPYTSVGLSPVLQFTLLPVGIYLLSGYFLKGRTAHIM